MADHTRSIDAERLVEMLTNEVEDSGQEISTIRCGLELVGESASLVELFRRLTTRRAWTLLVKGAFTVGIKHDAARCDVADGGTLYLAHVEALEDRDHAPG